jgi:gas vesicle protein
MTMNSFEDGEERRWLGGEAQVQRYNGRPRLLALRRWLASENLPLLAAVAAMCAALGGVGTAGAMMAGQRQSKSIEQETVRTSRERSKAMGQRREDEPLMREEEMGSVGAGTVLVAFGLGLLAGALATLLSTPEPGESVRRRVRRGVETAREELDAIVEESKESWSRVRDDAQDAVKRTATRIKEAAKVTKDAVVEGGSSVPKTP